MHHRLYLWLMPFLLAALVTAQGCAHQGSRPTPALWERGPIALGCAGAPDWPIWHLFTPAHRAPAPRPGFDPGPAQALPRLLIAWQCTGWLLLPVVPTTITTMGYVVDRPEIACSITP